VMKKSFDIIVVGLGANGSSALYHLSKLNKRVLGIDRFTPPHEFGSSHGESRIIRQAYHENPIYVPFIKQAYDVWYEMERISGEKLLLKTGGLMLGEENSYVVSGARLSAETHGIDYEYLDYNELLKRFPAFKPNKKTVGILEHEAGILFPEKCIRTFLYEAQKNGACIVNNEMVLAISFADDRVAITTAGGVYTAEKVIISTGAWMSTLLPGLKLPLTVERQVLHWFKNTSGHQQQKILAQKFPVYIWEYLPGRLFYGFPDIGSGIKIARHHQGKLIKPDELTQQVSGDEIEQMKYIVDTHLNMEVVYDRSAVCMYTNTPDEDFIIDYHPEFKNVILASPCSGHGFKFSSITGKLLCDMATDGYFGLDISPFSLKRFTNA
jgi:sarcosine oxidase